MRLTSVPSLPLDDASGHREPHSSAHLLLLADRHRRWIFGFVAVIYLIGFNGQWHIEPDSALYLTIARNLAEGHGYSYHGQTPMHAYPGWPWLLAGTFKVFGIDHLVPAHGLMCLMTLLALALTYRLFLLHAGRPTAVVVTAMVGLMESVYQYTLELRNDLPFLVGVMATLVGYEVIVRSLGQRGSEQKDLRAADDVVRRAHPTLPDVVGAAQGASSSPESRDPKPEARTHWFDLVLFPLGLLFSAVMRPTMLALLPCVALGLLWAVWRSRRRWVGMALIGLVVLVGAGFYLLDPRRGSDAPAGGYEDDMVNVFTQQERFAAVVHRTVYEFLPQLWKSTTVSAFGHQLGPGIDIVAFGALLALGLGLGRRRALWGLWVAATFAVMLVQIPRDRYFLPILPLLAFAWWQAMVWVNRRLGARWGNVAFIFLATLWLGPNLVKIGNAIIEQRHRPYLKYYKEGRFDSIQALGRKIERHVPEDRPVLAPLKLGRILSYFSHRRVLDDWERQSIDLDHFEGYVVLPAESKLDGLMNDLQAHHLHVVDPPLAEEPRHYLGKDTYKGAMIPPWTLHAVRPAEVGAGVSAGVGAEGRASARKAGE